MSDDPQPQTLFERMSAIARRATTEPELTGFTLPPRTVKFAPAAAETVKPPSFTLPLRSITFVPPKTQGEYQYELPGILDAQRPAERTTFERLWAIAQRQRRDLM